MVCESCGEKPKNTAKDFTKAVIDINNPEALVLLRKVVIPASMGDDTTVPPAVGKYHNVILYYEVNKHTYLYSSDGIPTLLEAEMPQEILDDIDELFRGLSYSVSEVNTGTTWVDGKNIYKKTISIPSLPNATTGHYSIGETNISNIVKLEGFFSSGSDFYPLPYVSNIADGEISLAASTTNIVIATRQDYSDKSGYVTVYYTKTQ